MTEKEIKQEGIKYANECGAKPNSTEHWNITMGVIAGIKLGLKQHSHDYLVKTINLKKKYEKQLTEKDKQIEKMKNCNNCANYMISGKCPCFFRTGWCKNWEMTKE